MLRVGRILEGLAQGVSMSRFLWGPSKHKQGENRNQMFIFSLDSAIAADAFVRVVDAFVNAIDLKSFGFAHVECHEEGCPTHLRL